MPKFNLHSPTFIGNKYDLDDLIGSLANELALIESVSIRAVVRNVSKHLSDFVQFPARAILLWHGCDRVATKGERQKIHKYPARIQQLAKENGISLDRRPNGPAIASYILAGGNRPNRTGSANAWSTHHLYSGKFPYVGKNETTHAARDPNHFTQSAGLIAVHPIADAICDEFPCFAWLLRAEVFRRFRYDPDHVFASRHDKFGFASRKVTRVIYTKE
jgi:hypothetical protein